MITNSLRGVGPKSFVSYSFQDKQLATQLFSFLTSAGFQVRMEDETSLLNERLPDVLARRINDVECFVQIRTATANRSHWVGKEFEFAELKRAIDENFTLLPIVFDATTLDEPTRHWVYIDASAGLGPDVLALVRDAGLRSVRRARVDPGKPTTILSSDIDAVLAGPDSRRLIIDADGFWFDRLDEVLNWSTSAKEAPHHAAFLEQERDRRKRLAWSLSRADMAGRILARELRASVMRGIVDHGAAKLAFETFYRLVYDSLFWPIVQNAAGLKLMAIDDETKDLPKFGDAGASDVEATAMAWSLRLVVEERRRIAHSGDDGIVKTGLQAARDTHSAYVYFPRSALGDDWTLFRDPRSLILQRDWVMFGLPQIAARAIGMTRRHNPEAISLVSDEIENGMGWAITDYSDIGLP